MQHYYAEWTETKAKPQRQKKAPKTPPKRQLTAEEIRINKITARLEKHLEKALKGTVETEEEREWRSGQKAQTTGSA